MKTINSLKYLITFPLGTNEQIARLDQLFLEGKFNPVDDRGKPLGELLAIPLNKESLKKKRKAKQSK